MKKMGLPKSSSSTKCIKHRKQFPIEGRPRMLKDFLSDDLNSCSANGFNSLPRKPCDSSSSMLETYHSAWKNNTGDTRKLLRSRSKAASATISAFQAIINALKKFPFPATAAAAATAAKSPAILPGSLSRRFSKQSARKDSNKQSQEKITVTVKDIIRWRSFRDLVDEGSTPLDLASSPHDCTTATTGSTASTPRSSKGSSWCDSDFTSESLPCWNGDSDAGMDGKIGVVTEMGKKYLPCVGEDSLEAGEVGPKEEEKEQQSPISAIEFEFEEEDEEESLSSFDQSLAAMQRAKEMLMEKIRRFENLAKQMDPINAEEWTSMDELNSSSGQNDEKEEEKEVIGEVEEKAWQLLEHAKAANALERCKYNVDQLLLDFFIEELSTRRCQSRIEESTSGVFNKAKAWINGEQEALLVGWEAKEKTREAYLREMDEQNSWSGFGEEQEELALAVESNIVGVLIEEVLLDLLSFGTRSPHPNFIAEQFY